MHTRMNMQLERMRILYKAGIPIEIVNIIDLKIKTNAINLITNYWRNKIQDLTNCYLQYCNQSKTSYITQEDINLVFALKRAIKNKCIRLDYVFWSRLVINIYDECCSKKLVSLGYNIYTNSTGYNIIEHYCRLLCSLNRDLIRNL